MSNRDCITVLAFGSAADLVGWTTKTLTLSAEQPLAELIETLERESPRLADARGRIRYAVNQRYVSPDALLKPGDEVAIVPPVSGGTEGRPSAARAPTARLLRDPIDLAAVVREVESRSVGAIATLACVVQYETNDAGRPLKSLEYQAYEPMALAEMHSLCAEATQRYPVHKVLLVQRLGRLKIGDTSAVAAVSSPHRAEAIQACQALIDGLAKSAPVFCKQTWQDGAATWVHEA